MVPYSPKSLWLMGSHNLVLFMGPKLPKSLPYGLLGSPYGSLKASQWAKFFLNFFVKYVDLWSFKRSMSQIVKVQTRN
jgi:hypothetical protein